MPMLPFATPNHVRLISACYPPSAALLTSGPDYRPNAQELSRLTYYAANRPGKINKLASELEKRAKIDCRKAQAGNTRARASLLITLNIFKALATECRRDISLLSGSLLSAINGTLSAIPSDLEVAARAASVFTAWATYTDGILIGVDRSVTQDYLSSLKHFSRMGRMNSEDQELRNRTRLVGLAALTASVHSEALFHSSSQLEQQASLIVPALLTPVFHVDIDTLNREIFEMKDQPSSPYLEEYRNRPNLERRANSIHLHVDGDKGPSSGDVANAALRAFTSLFRRSSGNQASVIMGAVFESLDETSLWTKVDHCCWFAEKAAEWTQYQYRYAIPTRLVEALVEGHDAPQVTTRQSTLTSMITSVFKSSVPLVNLSTSDIISSLISLILRRVMIDPDDALLPALVECIASLGTHIYYADQIRDLAGEMISRLIIVDSNGVSGNGKGNADKARRQALRCLLAGLLGLMHAADMHDSGQEDDMGEKGHLKLTLPLSSTSNPAQEHDVHVKPARRSRVAPEVWQDTLTLICDSEYAVRADYAVALILYLEKEIPKFGDEIGVDGVKRTKALRVGPSQQAETVTAVIYGDNTTRFLNALHAHIYVLATSPNLVLNPTPSTPSPAPPENERDSPTKDGSNGQDASSNSREHSRKSISAPRSRKISTFLRAVKKVPDRVTLADSSSAVLSDYGNIQAVMTAVHEHQPIRGLLTGVPMLLALDLASRFEDASDPSATHLLLAIKQIIAHAWLAIGRVWDCAAVVELIEKQQLSSMQGVHPLPKLPDVQPGTFGPPSEPLQFTSAEHIPVDALPTFDSETLLLSIASCQKVQEATGLDQEGLLRRLSTKWSAESAFKDSVETKSNYEMLRRDGLTPLIKVAPSLMHIENMSLQSLARSTRPMGVTDLREALEGRSSASNPNLANKPPSISTLDHTSAHTAGEYKLTPTRSRPQRSKVAGPGEVRDVLNQLGIGKQNGNQLLKASFPPLQKSQQRLPTFAPPYKT